MVWLTWLAEESNPSSSEQAVSNCRPQPLSNRSLMLASGRMLAEYDGLLHVHGTTCSCADAGRQCAAGNDAQRLAMKLLAAEWAADVEPVSMALAAKALHGP